MGSSVANSGVPFLSTIEGEYQLNKEMAKAAEDDAKYNATQRRKQADRLMGEQVAAFGASGVELEGSPLDLIKQDLVDAEMEAMNIVYAGKLKRYEMKRRAALGRKAAYEGLAKDAASMGMKG